MKPLCYDLFCGLGGWADGFMAEGWSVIGFDIEKHDYGTGAYPGELRIRNVLDIHGCELADADMIVASPPCQAYSYRAMPWKKAKALPPPDNSLFEACFRIQREACEAAGRHIPMIIENVRGAQTFVGPAAWHFGSFYLWGDVPALMPYSFTRKPKHAPLVQTPKGTAGSISWFFGNSKHEGRFYGVKGIPHRTTSHWTNPLEHENGTKGFTPTGGSLGKNELGRKYWSTSVQRKMASAMIAKIPFPLASHIARVFHRNASI